MFWSSIIGRNIRRACLFCNNLYINAETSPIAIAFLSALARKSGIAE